MDVARLVVEICLLVLGLLVLISVFGLISYLHLRVLPAISSVVSISDSYLKQIKTAEDSTKDLVSYSMATGKACVTLVKAAEGFKGTVDHLSSVILSFRTGNIPKSRDNNFSGPDDEERKDERVLAQELAEVEEIFGDKNLGVRIS